MTLHELGIKHGTDKVDHNYLKVYDELFSIYESLYVRMKEDLARLVKFQQSHPFHQL